MTLEDATIIWLQRQSISHGDAAHSAATHILLAALPSLPMGHLVQTLRCVAPIVTVRVQCRKRSEAGT